VFPGNPNGSLSWRLAAALFELVVGATCLMTMHGWYATGEVIPYVEYPQAEGAVVEASFQAARACGLERIMALNWHPGLLPAAAVRSGIPAIEVEIGGRGQSTPANQALYRAVAINFLRHWGVLPGKPQVAASIVSVQAHHLFAPADGMLRKQIELGQIVQAGQPLISIVGLDGQTLAKLTAPVAGEVAALRYFAPVQAGDHVLAIFETLE
jgi:predicted deacylase